MKILTIVGARPNFIKIDPDMPNQIIVHTGQHYDFEMSQIFFKELELPRPKYNLESRKVGHMVDKLMGIIHKEEPSIVLVYGDTNSSLAGALAASYCKIPVIHVEAGMRSGTNMPEEINRIVIDRLAKVRFCPNHMAEMNLMKEGLTKDNYVVGDPLFDAFGKFLPIKQNKNYKKYVLVTLHRDINVDRKEFLEMMIKIFSESKEKYIFPLHPRTEKNLRKFKLTLPKNVRTVKPAKYSESLALISNAKKVITDSGGVQREAFWMNVPVIIVRKETEWNNILLQGGGVLADTEESITDALMNFNGKINAPPEKGADKRIREIIYKYV